MSFAKKINRRRTSALHAGIALFVGGILFGRNDFAESTRKVYRAAHIAFYRGAQKYVTIMPVFVLSIRSDAYRTIGGSGARSRSIHYLSTFRSIDACDTRAFERKSMSLRIILSRSPAPPPPSPVVSFPRLFSLPFSHPPPVPSFINDPPTPQTVLSRLN